MEALVCKVSEKGTSMLVGAKRSKYAQGYTFGWCANPDGLKKGDKVADFEPVGLEPVYDEHGEQVMYTDGAPVMRWIF